MDYDAHPNGLPQALECLLDFLKPTSSRSDIEARRNCYLAMPQILSTIVRRLPHHVSPDVVNALFDALQDGLEDYTIDERGDVGSWIRTACIRGLTSFSGILISNASSIPNFDKYFPPSKYHRAIGGILKQGVERLDNVRQEAGWCFLRLLNLSPPSVPNADRWQMPGLALMRELFGSGVESVGWNDGKWLFPKAVRLLEVQEYRKPVLTGLVLSLGSKTDSTQRPVASSLVSYADSLPLTAGKDITYDLTTFVEELIDHAKTHVTSNLFVVPVLQTFNVLLEAGSLRRLSEHPQGLESLDNLLSITSKNVFRLKSIPRIHESMKIVVNLLTFRTLFDHSAEGLVEFLAHPFPSIRTDTAEYLYIALQSLDVGRETDAAEEVLLETEWSSSDTGVAKEASSRVVHLLQTTP